MIASTSTRPLQCSLAAVASRLSMNALRQLPYFFGSNVCRATLALSAQLDTRVPRTRTESSGSAEQSLEMGFEPR